VRNPRFAKDQNALITDEMLRNTINVANRMAGITDKYVKRAAESRAMLMIALMVLKGEASKEDLTPEFWEISTKIVNGTWDDNE
jgi:hypothetical protein